MSEITQNLRHLRVFLAVAEENSVTLASELCRVSQPAVTQTIGKLERLAGEKLFQRSRQGLFLTSRGEALARRARRAFAILDTVLDEISPRLRVTATRAQLLALVAVRDTENFTIAAKRLGLSQPTVHRAVTTLEHEANCRLFERTAHGMVATRTCQQLAHAARLAFSELDQAEADLGEFDGQEVGRIIIGSLPMARSFVLPKALIEFRKIRKSLPVTVIDGTYIDLIGGLRRGDIDMVLGALRSPPPIDDVVEQVLCEDRVVLLCGRHHPLASRRSPKISELAEYPWVVPRVSTPTRANFDAWFAGAGLKPKAIIEAGSVLFMRQVLESSDYLACISRSQSESEIQAGLLVPLDVSIDWPERNFGITLRRDWSPTHAQQLLLDLFRKIAGAS